MEINLLSQLMFVSFWQSRIIFGRGLTWRFCGPLFLFSLTKLVDYILLFYKRKRKIQEKQIYSVFVYVS